MTTPQQAHAEQRTEPVTVPGLTRTYPAPSEFDDIDVRDRSRTTITLFAKAPWFHRAAVLHGGVCDRYADERGMLPGEIHLSALTSFAWLEHFCCNYGDLRPKGDKENEDLQYDFVRSALAGLDRLGTFRRIAPEMGMDLFVYRTYGEIGYVERVNGISAALLESWRGLFGVEDAAYLLGKPQLCIEFRFLRKTSNYWTNL